MCQMLTFARKTLRDVWTRQVRIIVYLSDHGVVCAFCQKGDSQDQVPTNPA
jgi:hypothetical protein